MIPPKKKEAKEKKEKEEKKKKKKRKRESSSSNAESATKTASVDTIRIVVSIKIRSIEGEVYSPQGIVMHVSCKGKEKVGDSVAAPESHVGEVYHRREVLPFRHDTLFTDLGHKSMITRFKRATSHLISKMDVDHLEFLPPSDKVRQF